MNLISSFFKRTTVCFLIVVFLMISFLGNDIRITKAFDPTNPAGIGGAGPDFGHILETAKEAGMQKKRGEKVDIVKASAKAAEVEVAAAKKEVAAPTDSGSSECESKCPGSTWIWKIQKNIENAICNMQCTIIDWEASMIGWVIGKVLFPALGLCKEGDSSAACPNVPAPGAATK